MIKLLKTAFAALIIGSLSACAIVDMPAKGAIYGDVQFGEYATTAPRPTKMGESCAGSVLGLFSWGDSSVNTTRTKGGINQISSVDHHSTSILGVYGKYCTIVRGN